MERKITRIGNSLGVTMTDAIKALGLAAGDSVNVKLADSQIIITRTNKVELPEGISPDFFDSYQKLIQAYDQTLRDLTEK